MDAIASDDLALSTMRSRQSTLSSLCNWLVKRSLLSANPVARLDRPTPMSGKNIWRRGRLGTKWFRNAENSLRE
jgi:site-specific recombinase XerC